MRDAWSVALLSDFLLESRERMDHLEELLLGAAAAGSLDAEALKEVQLELHTLKGNAGLVGLTEMQTEAHFLEDLVSDLKPGAPPEEELLAIVDRLRSLLQRAEREDGSGSVDPVRAKPDAGAAGETVQGGVRVAFTTLDSLVDRLEEMVIFRNRLTEALERQRRELGAAARSASGEAVREAHDELGGTLDALRDGILRLRLVPLATLFRSLRRIAHDESVRSGKDVVFETLGGETPLDRGLLELASEALGHLIRNAVIHGIETPEERRRLGKPRAMVRVAASADTREVRIDVVDDGGGVRRQEVLAAAARRGLAVPADADPVSFLFLPGFSTRAEADLGAGRGIGLAAVQEAVSRRGGRIEVFSEEGVGTLFRLRLPLSVSILRALLVASDGEDYALPLGAMEETFRLDAGLVHEINGGLVLARPGGLVPFLDLGYCFGTSPVRRRSAYAVLLESEGSRRAVGVDGIQGIREVVVRRLDPWAVRHPAVAGSTILADGRAVLLLDPAGLAGLSPLADPGRAA
jgi:two-component system, chemotaxis family, sensor kinase CheA